MSPTECAVSSHRRKSMQLDRDASRPLLLALHPEHRGKRLLLDLARQRYGPGLLISRHIIPCPMSTTYHDGRPWRDFPIRLRGQTRALRYRKRAKIYQTLDFLLRSLTHFCCSLTARNAGVAMEDRYDTIRLRCRFFHHDLDGFDIGT